MATSRNQLIFNPFVVGFILLYILKSAAENKITSGIYDHECSHGAVHHGQHCYTYFKHPMIYANAKSICAAEHGQLVKIKDLETFRFVRAYLGRMTRASDYWIGISDRLSEGDWIYISDNSSVLTYSNWFAGEPNNGFTSYSNQDCGAMRLDLSFQWVDRECEGRFLYMCKFQDTTKDCTSRHVFNNNCYYLSRERATFDAAEKSCIQKGGKLAEIQSRDEQAFLAQIISKDGWWKNWTLEQLEEVGDSNAFAWIGVQKDRLINSWVYADGERPINHEFWQVGQPGSFSKDNDCVGINTRFTTAQCNQFYPFICQYEVDNQTQNQQEVQTVSPETIAGIAVAGGAVLLVIVMAILCFRRQSSAKKSGANKDVQAAASCNSHRPPIVTPRKRSDNSDHTRIQQFYTGSDGYLYPNTEGNYLEPRDDIKKETYIEIVTNPEDHVYASVGSNLDVIN